MRDSYSAGKLLSGVMLDENAVNRECREFKMQSTRDVIDIRTQDATESLSHNAEPQC